MGKGVVTRHWYSIALWGVVALILGLLLLAWPEGSLAALLTVVVVLFGIFLLAMGVVQTIVAIASARKKEKYLVTLVWGIISLLAGILIFAWPGITALALIYLIAIWSIVSGIIEISAAFSVPADGTGKALLWLSGLLSLALGIILISYPKTGATILVVILGIYLVVFGILITLLGFEMRHWHVEEVEV